VKLHRSGVSLREIAENLGISHQRVHQIVSPAETGRTVRRARRSAAAGTAMVLLAAATFSLGRATSGTAPIERAAPTSTPSPTLYVVTRCPFRGEPSTLALAAAAGTCQRRLRGMVKPGTGMIINPKTGWVMSVFSQSKRFTWSLPLINLRGLPTG
jgi:hypothetical protein